MEYEMDINFYIRITHIIGFFSRTYGTLFLTRFHLQGFHFITPLPKLRRPSGAINRSMTPDYIPSPLWGY